MGDCLTDRANNLGNIIRVTMRIYHKGFTDANILMWNYLQFILLDPGIPYVIIFLIVIISTVACF